MGMPYILSFFFRKPNLTINESKNKIMTSPKFHLDDISEQVSVNQYN